MKFLPEIDADRRRALLHLVFGAAGGWALSAGQPSGRRGAGRARTALWLADRDGGSVYCLDDELLVRARGSLSAPLDLVACGAGKAWCVHASEGTHGGARRLVRLQRQNDTIEVTSELELESPLALTRAAGGRVLCREGSRAELTRLTMLDPERVRWRIDLRATLRGGPFETAIGLAGGAALVLAPGHLVRLDADGRPHLGQGGFDYLSFVDAEPPETP